jgi:hypothetical protein
MRLMGSIDTAHDAAMPSPTTLPLSAADLVIAEGLLQKRRANAVVATRVAVILVVFFVVMLLDKLVGHASAVERGAAIGVILAVAAGLAFLVDRVAWRLVRETRKDIAAGVKHRRTGVLRRLSRVVNAHGESIMWVTLDDEKLVARGEFMAAFREGQRIAVDLLPGARLVLTAAPDEEMLA